MGLGTLKFSAPNAGCSAMSEEQNPIVRHDPEVGGLSFEPLDDVGPLNDVEPGALIVHAIAISVGTAVLGGAALTGAISTAARYFQAPEFADLQYLGFIMSGVLGLLLALAFLINAMRPNKRQSDRNDD